MSKQKEQKTDQPGDPETDATASEETKADEANPDGTVRAFYPGPHPEVKIGEIGTFKRGEVVSLPAEVGNDLIKRKKLKRAK